MANRHVIVSAAVLGLAAAPALGGAHTWDVVEVFSNADGTIQFIELLEANGTPNEVGLTGKWVQSMATGMQFNFPGNLIPPTSNKSLLLATAGYAALSGVPAPDYIIPDSFVSTNADESIIYFIYDNLTFTAGTLPLDGFNSLHDGLVTGPNTPKNYAGETGTVNLCPEDLDHDGAVGTSDLLAMLAAWGTTPGGPPDLDGGGVGTSDLLQLLASWGPC